MKTKLQLADSTQDVMFKMSEVNPGALTVILKILADGSQIDPDSAMGGLGAILSLDSLGIYGSKIWMLYKDVCDCDLPRMLAVLRGWQLGFVKEPEIRHAVENRGAGMSLEGICQKVAERLPKFKFSVPD